MRAATARPQLQGAVMGLLRVGTPQLGRLRFGPWRGDARVASIAPTRLAFGPVSAADVRDCVERAGHAGYDQVLTAALGRRDQPPFLEAGFEVEQRLHLLVHTLDRLPRVDADVSIHRARRRDRQAVLAVDHAAFEPFWRLDDRGLSDALAATSAVRFRVARADGRIVGYAITGRAEHRGYVQRLAVSPRAEGRGVGAALLIDGLRWLRRRGARDAVVNTQEGNERSLKLYLRSGFVVQPEGLAVLGRHVFAPPGRADGSGWPPL
jgi:ribosomal protein S18 acetylase RimI-like enzyme